MPEIGTTPFLIAPTDTAASVSQRPVFTWTPSNGARRYRLIVIQGQQQNRYLDLRLNAARICTESLCTLDLSARPGARALRQGRNYRWRVVAIHDDARYRTPFARFVVGFQADNVQNIPFGCQLSVSETYYATSAYWQNGTHHSYLNNTRHRLSSGDGNLLLNFTRPRQVYRVDVEWTGVYIASGTTQTGSVTISIGSETVNVAPYPTTWTGGARWRDYPLNTITSATSLELQGFPLSSQPPENNNTVSIRNVRIFHCLDETPPEPPSGLTCAGATTTEVFNSASGYWQNGFRQWVVLQRYRRASEADGYLHLLLPAPRYVTQITVRWQDGSAGRAELYGGQTTRWIEPYTSTQRIYTYDTPQYMTELKFQGLASTAGPDFITIGVEHVYVTHCPVTATVTPTFTPTMTPTFTPTMTPTATVTPTPTPVTCRLLAVQGEIRSNHTSSQLVGYVGNGSGDDIVMTITARHVDVNMQGWFYVSYPANSVRDNSNVLLPAGQGWIRENTSGLDLLGGCDTTRLPTTSDVALTPTPTGTQTAIPCRAEQYTVAVGTIQGADFLGRYARAEMAGDASLVEGNRDIIVALMLPQFNHFFFGRNWKLVSTIAGDPTALYPPTAPQLPRDIADDLITIYCVNGEDIAATFNGKLSTPLYNKINAAGLFENQYAVFEISFHPDHISAVESIPNSPMIALQVTSTRAIGIGTTSYILLDYQCPNGYKNYVQRDPNNGGNVLSLIEHADCYLPSACSDVDYWVVTSRNDKGQRTGVTLFEQLLPDEEREWFLKCDFHAGPEPTPWP